MKKYVILHVGLLFTISIYGKIFKPDTAGLNYFIKGSELINLGDYKGADSLLSLAYVAIKMKIFTLTERFQSYYNPTPLAIARI